jgi:hypothetical protein
MSKFLKLTSMIINVSQIQTIQLLPNKYRIHLVPNKNTGFFFHDKQKYEICEKKNTQDYKIVSKWLNYLDTNLH